MTMLQDAVRAIILTGCTIAPAAARDATSPPALQAGAVSTEHVDTVPMAAAGTVSVERTWGAVRVEGWDEASVKVRVSARAKSPVPAADAAAAQQDLDGFAARIVHASPSAVTITALSPGNRALKRFGGRRGIALTYTISMPRTADLVLRHRVGSVEIVGLSSNVNVASRVGDVRISTPLGPTVAVTASATIGDVSIAHGGGVYRQRALVGRRYSDAPVGADRSVVARVRIGSVEID